MDTQPKEKIKELFTQFYTNMLSLNLDDWLNYIHNQRTLLGERAGSIYDQYGMFCIYISDYNNFGHNRREYYSQEVLEKFFDEWYDRIYAK